MAARYVPVEVLDEVTKNVHEGECPRCHGRVRWISILAFHLVGAAADLMEEQAGDLLPAVWREKPRSSRGLVRPFSAGGISVGIVMTPVQIARNNHAVLSPGRDEALGRLEKTRGDVLGVAAVRGPEDAATRPASIVGGRPGSSVGREGEKSCPRFSAMMPPFFSTEGKKG